MKNMKKLLAALLAVMVMVLAAPAVFAEDLQPETTEQPAPEVQAVEEVKVEEVKAEETAQPEATVEATTAPEATVEAQPEETPAPEAAPAVEATQTVERSVKVLSDGSNLQVGDTMTLTAQLTGFDGIEYQLTWQVKTEGGDWQNLSGEHGDTLKVKLDDQSIGSSWRVVVETND